MPCPSQSSRFNHPDYIRFLHSKKSPQRDVSYCPFTLQPPSITFLVSMNSLLAHKSFLIYSSRAILGSHPFLCHRLHYKICPNIHLRILSFIGPVVNLTCPIQTGINSKEMCLLVLSVMISMWGKLRIICSL